MISISTYQLLGLGGRQFDLVIAHN